jgi:hypothetical protein
MGNRTLANIGKRCALNFPESRNLLASMAPVKREIKGSPLLARLGHRFRPSATDFGKWSYRGKFPPAVDYACDNPSIGKLRPDLTTAQLIVPDNCPSLNLYRTLWNAAPS